MKTNAPELENEKEKFYKTSLAKIKGTLSDEVFNNPAFEPLFHKELNYFLYKTNSVDFTVLVSDDKKTVSITSYNPICDCRKELVGKNKAFLRTLFYVQDGYLVCDFNQGVLFSRKDIENIGYRLPCEYETKLETAYSTKFFDADGIQISDNSYTDVYPFLEKFRDIDLRERTMSSFHKPKFKVEGFPVIPIHIIRATVRNTYRKYDSLGILHSNMGTALKEGYSDVICGLYTCHTARPELLRGFNRIAETKGNKNTDLKFKVANDYASDINEAYEKAKKEFKAGVENNSEENDNRNAREAIKKYISND